jgi:hypothetical protein
MTDEDRSQDLPHRVRGAARGGPGPSRPSPPSVSAELRQRMQAAVEAERGETAVREEDTTESSRPMTPSRPDHGDVPNPPVNEASGLNKANEANGANGQQARPPQPPLTISVPRRPRPRRKGRARLVASALVIIVIGSLALLATKHLAASPSDNTMTGAALLRAEAKARDQTAAWVTQQVSHNAVVSCDQVMCGALTRDGFPSRKLLVVGQASPDPLSSAVVVVTAAIRGMFGTSISAAYAPAVLASFGSGIAEISVRVIAPHGATAFQAALQADLAGRRASEAPLPANPRITVSGPAAKQLAAGEVDARLVLAIASLAGDQPIDIVRFGNIGPGGSPDMPLRFADLAANDQAAHMGRSAYMRSLLALLGKVAQYRPDRTIPVTVSGQAVLRVEFTAPSPLGLFSAQGSG